MGTQQTHAVEFFSSEHFPARKIAAFLVQGSQPPIAIAIVDRVHHAMLEREGRAFGLECGPTARPGGLALWDATETLERIMKGNHPDLASFQRAVGDVLEPLATPGANIRIYGDMVDILWSRGRSSSALALEDLWNEFLHGRSISLLCGYRIESFDVRNGTASFDAVCSRHAPARPDDAGDGEPRRLRAELDLVGMHLRAEQQRRKDIEGISAPIMVWATGVDKKCTYFNAGWLAFTGRSLAEEMGDGWTAGVHPDDLQTCFETYSTSFDARINFQMEYRLRRHDGQYRVVFDTGVPRYDSAGVFEGYVGACLDVTARKNAARARAEAWERLERVAFEWTWTFDSLDQAVVVLDAARRIRRLNHPALDLMGAPSYQSVIGTTLDPLATTEPWCTVRDLTAAGEDAEGGTRRARSGARTFEVTAHGRRHETSGEAWQIVTVRDVSEIVQLQEAMRRQERMAAIGSLVAGVAHEARTPLFGISATLDAFEKSLSRYPEYAECSALLRGSAQRLHGLMQDLLDYGRPVEPILSPGTVRDVLEIAVRGCWPILEQRAIRLVMDIPADCPLVPMDRTRLAQVFENLIANAAQVSTEGARIRVAAEANPPWLVCTVEDDGPGFPPGDLARVFEPFFSKRSGGTGLGLSIAQRLTEAHGGRLVALNRGEGGARVLVCLPLTANREPTE